MLYDAQLYMITAPMASSLKSPISLDGLAWKRGPLRYILNVSQHARCLQFDSIPVPQQYGTIDSGLSKPDLVI